QPQARRPSFRTLASACVPARARLLQEYLKTGGASPGMPPPRSRRPRLVRTAEPHPFSSPLLRAAGKETFVWTLSRNRAGGVWTSLRLPGSMPPARDRLTHIEWASAYLSDQVVPKQNRLQTQPSSGSSTADARSHQSDQGASRTASAPRSP